MSLITRSPEHLYTFEGVTYPGVTGVLKILDKSGPLIGWASRMTAEAAIALGPGLAALVESVGPEGAVKALSARSSWKRDDAASLGSEVHALADRLIRGERSLVVPERSMGHIEGYAAWWAASGWTVRASEALLINPERGYGGTLDLLCYDRDGRTVLADIKTGKAVYHEAVLQLAAYGAATWMETQGGEGLYEMPQVDRYAVLHVTHEGVREVEISVGAFEQRAFGACLELSAWRDAMKGKRL